jgi:2-dehydropantoate 2-reductase
VAVRSYTIVGAGALGAYYGASLAHAGLDVRFLLRSDWEQVRAHGLRVESVRGDLSLASPSIFRNPAEVPPSDVVLVGLKTTANHALASLLGPLTRPDATVLMMQNGLGIEEEAAAVVPGRTVLGGLAFLCANRVGPGHVRHLDYGSVRLAEYRSDGSAAGVTPAMEAIAADFGAAGIRVDLEEDLRVARWKKLVWNVPYNGLCVVRDTTTDVLMADPPTRALVREIMGEVRAIARGCGCDVPESFVEKMLADTEAMASYRPSMKLDFDAGRPLEVEALYARPIAAARAAGVACPRIEELHADLVRLDPGA